MFTTVIFIAKCICVFILLVFAKMMFVILAEIGEERKELIKRVREILRKIGVGMLTKQPTEHDILQRCITNGLAENMHDLLTFCRDKNISLNYACFTLRRVNTDSKIKFTSTTDVIRIVLPNGTVSFHLDKEPV